MSEAASTRPKNYRHGKRQVRKLALLEQKCFSTLLFRLAKALSPSTTILKLQVLSFG